MVWFYSNFAEIYFIKNNEMTLIHIGNFNMLDPAKKIKI